MAEIPLYAHTTSKNCLSVFGSTLYLLYQFNLQFFQKELAASAVVVVVVTGYKQRGLMSLKMPNPL